MVNMKLICVNNKTDEDEIRDLEISHYNYTYHGERVYYFNLTIGKSYENLGSNDKNLIKIKDDYGYSEYLPKHCFKNLDEIRDEKINTILDGK